MAHIELAAGLAGLPGIRALLTYRPETAGPINECVYCQSVHGAVAARQLEGGEALVDAVKCEPANAAISDKLKALLTIAGKTAEGGQQVTAPADPDFYRERGRIIIDRGYAGATVISS